MNPSQLQKHNHWWGPKLSRWSWRFWTPLRKRLAYRLERLVSIDVVNPEILSDLLTQDMGVMLTPNHSSHADPFAVYGISDAVQNPL